MTFTTDFTSKITDATSTKMNPTALQTLSDARTSGYEVIMGACIPYYDFDLCYESEKLRKSNEASDYEKNVAAVRKVFPKGKLIVFTAYGANAKKQYKNSLHILVRGVGYATCGKALPVVEGADENVYKVEGKRQLFRLPLFSKEKENRPLKPADGGNYCAEWFVNYLGDESLVWEMDDAAETGTTLVGESKYHDKLVETFPDIVKYKSFVKEEEKSGAIYINYRDIVKESCPLCKRTHEDNQFYGYVVDQKLFYKCKKSKASVFVFNWGEDTAMPTIAETTKALAVIDYSTRLDKYDPHKFATRYCSEYAPLMEAFDKDGVLSIVAGTGSGKTSAAAKAVKSMTNKSIGIVSFRISLAEKYQKDFDGFACYNQSKGTITDKRWICQLDSMYRVAAVPDMLIIDEISQARRHMSADTFMGSRNYVANRKAILRMMTKVKTLVVMDANTSALDLMWINSLRQEKPNIFLNTMATSPKTITLMKNDKRIITSVKEDLAAGRKVVIAHNGGKKHHEPLKRMLENKKNKILVINSDTNQDADVIAALKDPNAEFGKYDCIIYSPSVQSGVSFDVKNVFHRIYGIFSNCTNFSGDACQMLDRVRHPICTNTRVSITEYHTVKSRTIEALRASLSANRAHLLVDNNMAGSSHYNDIDDLQFINNMIVADDLKGEIEANMDRINYTSNFIKTQMIYGNKIDFEEDLSEKEEAKKKVADGLLKVEKKAITATVKTEIAAELNNSENLSVAALDAIKEKMEKKIDLVRSELVALKKYNLNKTFNMDEPVNDVKWYEQYDNAKLKKQYKNQFKYFRDYTLDQSVELLKQYEITNDRNMRMGDDIDDDAVDNYVVASLKRKPRYQKEKIMVGWIQTLGFDSLKPTIEIEESELKTQLVECLKLMDDTTVAILEKKKEKLASLKKLKVEDKLFMKHTLAFMNGSLKEYYGVSVVRKSKNSKAYVLKNDGVDKGLFKLKSAGEKDGNFKKNTPVLGKGNTVEAPPEVMRDPNEEPYDSDTNSDDEE